MERNCYSQKFGGFWTEEKLRLFTRYLEAYLKALQYQKFHKIYIDAFAGTGEIETKDRDILIPGSVKRALSASKKFDKYIFIEKDPNKVSQLKELLSIQNSVIFLIGFIYAVEMLMRSCKNWLTNMIGYTIAVFYFWILLQLRWTGRL